MGNTRQSIEMQFIVWVLAGVTSVMACVRPAAAAQDHRNGATWFGRAIGQMERFSDAEVQQLREYAASNGGEPSPEVRALLLRAGPMLEQFARGANQPYADFQLDRSEGFFLQLPHLQPFRSLAAMTRADALARLHDGDTLGAADRIAAMYRAGGHIAQDGIAISSLVGQAVFKFSDDAATMALDRAAFGVDESNRLLQAVATLNEDDPFDMLGAVVGEQELALTWLGEGTPEQQMTALGALLGDDPMGDARGEALRNMPTEEYQSHVAQFDTMMDQVVDMFAMDDPAAAREAITSLEQEIVAGEHGLMAYMLAPSYSTLLERKHEAAALVRARREALEALLGGDVAPREVANAAVWYLRAIDALSRIAEEHNFAAHELAIDPAKEVPDATIDFLDEAQPVIDELHEGSVMRQCHFGRAAGIEHAVFMPSYAPGMRDVFRLLCAETIRQVRAGEIDTAVDLLAMSCRILAHLGADPQMTSAIVSHRAFLDVAELITDADRAGLLDDDRRMRLRSAIGLIDRSDPFGYLSARRAATDRLISAMRMLRTIHRYGGGDPAGDARREPEMPDPSTLRDLDDAATLATLAALDEVLARWSERQSAARAGTSSVQATEASKPISVSITAAALADLIDLEAWQSLRARSPALLEAMRAGEITAIVQTGGPTLNRFAERRSQARQDLRAGVAVIELIPRAMPQPTSPNE